MGINISPSQCDKLLQFLALIKKWNRTHNLTAIKSSEEMVTKHLLDSLSIVPYLSSDHLLDVGCGAGLPGIPLAVALPDLHCHLIDASQKRIAFVKQAKRELNLPNVTADHKRVEDFHAPPFKAVISRAYSSLSDFVSSTRHLLAKDGQWLAMKGSFPQQEIEQLPPDVELIRSYPLAVPGLSAERHLICLQCT